MSEHHVRIGWSATSSDFSYAAYTRDHTWTFEGGEVVRASAAPAYKGNPALVDPEEAFVAALSSCHMLSFLALASKHKHAVVQYEDRAVGHLEKNEQGLLAITRVELHPRVTFAPGAAPSDEQLRDLHEQAHHICFIANSVRTDVRTVLDEPA